jgi:hypothetical protein
MAIAPDSKDWTWVLERPCPECGFDTSGVTGPEVSRLIRENVVVWLVVLRAGPEVRMRPRDDCWSTLEYACHVRDVFRVFDRRLALMMREDDPAFPNWDQDATALADAYGTQDPEIVSAELSEAATAVADRIDRLGADAWARSGTRSDGARFTVETLLRYLVHDPVHHLHDVGA